MYGLCYGKGQFLWISQSIVNEVFKRDNGSYLKYDIVRSAFDGQFLMNILGYWMVIMRVITLSQCTTCTGFMLNGFYFISAFSVDIFIKFRKLQNSLL